MDNLFVLCVILPFLFSVFAIKLFSPVEMSSKIILTMFISCVVIFLLFKYKEDIDLVENYFIKYSIILFILFCIYVVVEKLYIYGLNTTYSIILILMVLLVLFIVFNIYLFNNAFDEAYPLKSTQK